MNRWDQCVSDSDAEAEDFIRDYFPTRGKVLLIAGAGFDPRSCVVTKLVAAVTKVLSGIYIREDRSNPEATLLAAAEKNVQQLKNYIPKSTVIQVPVFDEADGAVVGAKRLIKQLSASLVGSEVPTDIVLDLSALSIGISFPLVRYIYESYRGKGTNIHIFVVEDIELDSNIRPGHTDQPMYVPGFDGGAALDTHSKAERLWIPQLVLHRKEALKRIHDFVKPAETCPILPFPAKNLRRGDELLEHFMTEVRDTWDVDPTSYIYAHEREPVDLYRTLIRLDEARKRVYEQHGGSLLVLSPIGSKVLALGSLLAALERPFPVAYLESVSYSLNGSAAAEQAKPQWPIVHLWLAGDAYA